MSTKIYNAYRVKRGYKLENLIRDWHRRAEEKTLLELDKLHGKLSAGVDTSSEIYKAAYTEQARSNNKDELEQKTRDGLALYLMEAGYKHSITSRERSYFDFNVCISFRFLRGRIYVQTYADTMHSVLDFIADDPRIEDYHYQNSADKPDHVTEKAWRQRERTWDEIYKEPNGRFENVVLDVMNWNTFEEWSIDKAFKYECLGAYFGARQANRNQEKTTKTSRT